MRAPVAADLLDQLRVARSIEYDDRQIGHLAAERVGDAVQVLCRGGADVDVAAGDRPDAQLLEVRVGRVEQPAAFRRGEDGDRVGEAHRDEVGALERIDGDVDLGLVGLARADLLADEEHRRLVALALADDDRAAHLDLVERLAHRLDRGAIGGHPVAAAHEARRLDRRRLGYADHLECEQRFHALDAHRSISGGSGGGR